MKAKQISENYVSLVNLRSAVMALERARVITKYTGVVTLNWFLTEGDRAFSTVPGRVFNSDYAGNSAAFVPIKDGHPQIWLHASLQPETIAVGVFHEWSHLPDIPVVFDRTIAMQARGLKQNDDHWAAWLYRQAYRESEDKAQLFQSAYQSEAVLIGAIARNAD